MCPPIEGSESMILTFSTKHYAHWLDLLIKTYRKTNPGKRAKVYLLMNFQDFDRYKSDDLIEYHWVPIHESLNMDLEKGRVRSVLRFKTSLILWELILNPGEKFIWTDADCLVLKDIQPILDKLDTYDFLCSLRPWKKAEQHRLAAGVMGFRSTQATINLMAKSAKDVWGHWEGWYSEQLHIYRNLRDNYEESGLNCYPLMEKEHSLKNDLDTIILSHHVNKYEDFAKMCYEICFFGNV